MFFTKEKIFQASWPLSSNYRALGWWAPPSPHSPPILWMDCFPQVVTWKKKFKTKKSTWNLPERTEFFVLFSFQNSPGKKLRCDVCLSNFFRHKNIRNFFLTHKMVMMISFWYFLINLFVVVFLCPTIITWIKPDETFTRRCLTKSCTNNGYFKIRNIMAIVSPIIYVGPSGYFRKLMEEKRISQFLKTWMYFYNYQKAWISQVFFVGLETFG